MSMRYRKPPQPFIAVLATAGFAIAVLLASMLAIAKGNLQPEIPSSSPISLEEPSPAPIQLNEPPPPAVLLDVPAVAPGPSQIPEATPNQPARMSMPPDIQRILERGKLVVAILETDNAPFFVTHNPEDGPQTLEGLDIKIAQGIADYLGVDIEFKRVANTFDEVVDAVFELDADLAISKLSLTLNRARRIQFSKPYLSMRQGLLLNRLKLDHEISSPTELHNLEGTIGVLQGSSYVNYVKNSFPKATLVKYSTWNDLVQSVVHGEILAACRDELEIKKVVLMQPETALQLQTFALTNTRDQLAIALPWDSDHLTRFVNRYLDAADINYTADSLLNEYAEFMQIKR